MQSVKFNKALHDREGFDCGVSALNHYFMLMANQQASRDHARTYVIVDEAQPERVMGYYTLTMVSIDITALPQNLQKKHRQAATAGLIARLAVDMRYSKKGYGAWLLVDALHRLLEASESVGFPWVVVDAKDGVADFYNRFGFQSFEDTPKKLFMTMEDIRKNLAAS
jgi:predicted N-acetyltransferase YhbS